MTSDPVDPPDLPPSDPTAPTGPHNVPPGEPPELSFSRPPVLPPPIPPLVRSGDWKLPLWLWLGVCIGGPLAFAGVAAAFGNARGGEWIMWMMLALWKLGLIATSVFVGIRRGRASGSVGGGIGLGFAAYAVGLLISLGVGFIGCLGLVAGTSFH